VLHGTVSRVARQMEIREPYNRKPQYFTPHVIGPVGRCCRNQEKRKSESLLKQGCLRRTGPTETMNERFSRMGDLWELLSILTIRDKFRARPAPDPHRNAGWLCPAARARNLCAGGAAKSM
jgi:hypothetical protein